MHFHSQRGYPSPLAAPEGAIQRAARNHQSYFQYDTPVPENEAGKAVPMPRGDEPPKKGDMVRIIVENEPPNLFSTGREGTLGKIGELMEDDESPQPYKIRFADGQAFWYKSSWVEKFKFKTPKSKFDKLWPMYEEKMALESGLSWSEVDKSINTFKYYFQVLTAEQTDDKEKNTKNVIEESEIRQVIDIQCADRLKYYNTEIEELKRLTSEERESLKMLTSEEDINSLRAKTVFCKLNGGLGTSMGLDKAKSLLKVTKGKTFLDIICEQADKQDIKVLFFNSDSTSNDTKDFLTYGKVGDEEFPYRQNLGRWHGLDGKWEAVGNKCPKVTKADYTPVTWAEDPSHEWYPGGHGDIYRALYDSGVLESLLEDGKKYMFVSNSDNLGATMNDKILGHFAKSKAPFMMEVTRRTNADKKGGHLAISKDDKFILRESAQNPKNNDANFQNTEKWKFFNTNNLWVDLEYVKKIFKKNSTLPLPVMKNFKTVDPRDPASTQVIQLEQAMGSAITKFANAQALVVDRSRFAPVKKCEDLLRLRSDAYKMNEETSCMVLVVKDPPKIEFDKEAGCTFVDGLEKMCDPNNSVSLKECKSLKIEGPVKFEDGITFTGEVVFRNKGKTRKEIKANKDGWTGTWECKDDKSEWEPVAAKAA